MAESNCIAPGTKVINKHDTEPGTIVKGITFDPATGECTEYEIRTAYGIEQWQRRDFFLDKKSDKTDR